MIPARDEYKTRISGRRALVVILLVLTLPATVSLTGCRKPQGKRPGERVGRPAPGTPGKPVGGSTLKAEFHKAEITWEDPSGLPVWKAQFKDATASQTEGGAVVELTHVEASLYTDGRVSSRLTAPKVTADSRTREVLASGGVKLISAEHKASASAERLVWKSKKHEIIATGGVRMQRENLTITATSLEADTALEKARFTKAVLSAE